MPCNCDHLEPTREEVRLSKIACLLDELRTGNHKINSNHWGGMHPKVYSQTYDKYEVPPEGMKEKLVQALSMMSPEKLQTYSLEMQMWWRDYCAEALERKKAAVKKFKDKKKKVKKLSLDELLEHGMIDESEHRILKKYRRQS